MYGMDNPVVFLDISGLSPVYGGGGDQTGGGDPYVRLIFHRGAKKSQDNYTFEWAAKNVSREYAVKPQLHPIINGRQIVRTINAQKRNSLQSIDFFVHGGYRGLWIAREENEPTRNLYMSEEAKWAEFENSSFESESIDDIDYSVFTESAKVEIHGCNACTNYRRSGDLFFDDDEYNNGENIAGRMFMFLFEAGKISAVTIGHDDFANPGINGASTRYEDQDYRFGTRVVYHNGEILFTTNRVDRITSSAINHFLEVKRMQGAKYNGLEHKW